jgi:hypothetical protein
VRGGADVAGGVEHRAATDDEQGTLLVEPGRGQPLVKIRQQARVVLDALAARNQKGRRGKLQVLLVRGDVSLHLGGEGRAGSD